MQGGLFGLVAVRTEAREQVNNKISGTSMARMLNLGNVLELIDDGLNDGSFADQELVREMHQAIGHVLAQPRDQMKPLLKKQLRQRSRDVPAIANELTTQMLDQERYGTPIIHVSRRQTAGEQISLVIDRQMQFEAKEPAHGGLATGRLSGKHAVLTDAFGMANCKCGRVDETDTCTRSVVAIEVRKHRYEHVRNESDKPLVAHLVWKLASEMDLDILGVVGFERSVLRLMKRDENGHDLTRMHGSRSLALLAILNLGLLPLWGKTHPEIIDSTE
jgi:hypothetical protein